MGRKKGRKRKNKRLNHGGSTQQQQQHQNKVLQQSNLDGFIVESLDVEGFGDCFHPTQSTEVTRINFQNSRPQPQYRTSKKATDGALAMEAGKFDVLLFAEHGLYPPALQPWHGWHDQMCTRNKGKYSRLSYNTNDGERTKWNQYGGTGITLNADLKSRITTKGKRWRSYEVRAVDMGPNWRQGRYCYCLCIGVSTLQKHDRSAYSLEPARTIL